MTRIPTLKLALALVLLTAASLAAHAQQQFDAGGKARVSLYGTNSIAGDTVFKTDPSGNINVSCIAGCAGATLPTASPSGTTLAVSNVSAHTAFTANTSTFGAALITNDGSNEVFWNIGNNVVTASTAGPALPPGYQVCVAIGAGNTDIAGVTAVTASTLRVTQLTACPNISGGGSGGGAGGSVNLETIAGTIADVNNGNATLGTLRVTVAADSTGVLSVKQNVASNPWVVSQAAGNWQVNVATINGTAPLMQTSSLSVSHDRINGATVLQGPAASGRQQVAVTGNIGANFDAPVNQAAPANALSVAGVFNTAQQTFTTGNLAPLQTDSHGYLYTNVQSMPTTTVTGTVAATQSAPPWTMQVVDGVTPTQKLAVSPAGVLTVSGTVTAAQATPSALQMTATQAGTWTVQQGTPPWSSSIVAGGNTATVTAGGALTVTGTVTANAGTGNFGTNLVQVGGNAVVSSANGVQRVGVAGSAGAFFDAPTNTTAPANDLQVGATVTSGASAYTVGNLAPLNLDTSGNLKVNIVTGATTGVAYGTTFSSVTSATPIGVRNSGGTPILTFLSTDGAGAGGNLLVNCAVGCSGGSASNASDAVATSATNNGSISYLYAFNGTTFDRLRVDGSKNLNVNLAANSFGTVSISGGVTQVGAPWTYQLVDGTVTSQKAAVSAGGALTVAGTVTAQQGGSPWGQNLTQVANGTVSTTGVTGQQLVGVVGHAGALFDAVQNGSMSGINNVLIAGGVFHATPVTITDTNATSLQTDVNGFLKVNVAAGGAAGGTSSSFAAVFPATGTAVGAKGSTGNLVPLTTDAAAGGNLNVNCVVGCSAGTGTGANNADAVVSVGTGLGSVVSYGYGYNGTTWDRLQVDASKNLKVLVNAALPAGANNIGTVNAAQSGTWTTNILGNAGAKLDVAGQNQSPTGINELIVGGQFNTTPATITTGNLSPLQLDSTGSLKVALWTGAVTPGLGGSTDAQSTQNGLFVHGQSQVFNGATWDLQRGDATNGTWVNVKTGTVAATQSGTWTVQPGNTANTTPWLTTIAQGGNSATVNASGQLTVNCAAGCSSLAGNVNNNADAVATSSTNIGSVSYLYALDVGGTTFSRLRLDGSKNLSVNIAASAVTVPVSGSVNIADPVTPTQKLAVNAAGAISASANVIQFGGNNIVTGTGTSGLGIPRVTVSQDSRVILWDGTTVAPVKLASTAAGATDPSLVVALSPNSPLPTGSNAIGAVTVTSGSVTANQGTGNGTGNWTVNLNQFAGVAPTLNAGAAGSGTLRTVLTNDYSSTTNARITGNIGGVLDAIGVTTAPANEIMVGGKFQSPAVSGMTNGQIAPLQVDNTANLLVRVNASSQLDTLITDVTSPIPAGSNNIGKVNILGNGGVALDTSDNTTAPTNGLAVMGEFISAFTPLTTGQGSKLQLDANGNLKIAIQSGGGSGGTASTFGAAFPTAGLGTAIGVNNSAGTTMTYLSTDATTGGNLKINCVIGCSGGTLGNNADAVTVTTNTNIGSDSYLYGFNGTTWDRLRTAALGMLKVGIVGNAGVALDAVNNATIPANSLMVGGSVTTAAPTYTTGSMDPLSLDTTGNLRVNVVTGALSANISQFGGSNISTGAGAGGAGIPRVTVSNDSSLALHQSVNVDQWAGTGAAAGNGTNANALRVTVASDSTGLINSRVTGNAGGIVDGGNNSTLPANGVVIAGSVTTAAPTYTTGNMGDLSLTTGGALRTSTDVASFAGTASAAGNGTNGNALRVTVASDSTGLINSRVTGNGGAIVDGANNTTLPANGLVIAGSVTTAAPTYTTGNMGDLSLTTGGALRTSTDVASFSGTASAAGNGTNGNALRVTVASDSTGLINSRVTGNAGAIADGANNSTLPANAFVMAGSVTTAAPSYTTGNMGDLSLTTTGGLRTSTDVATFAGTAPTVKATGTNAATTDTALVVAESPNPSTVCSSILALNQTSSTDLVTSTAKLHICAMMVVSATAQNISLVEGTGTVCATNIAALMGGTTASIAVAANGGWTLTSPRAFMISKTTADHLCLLQSGAGNVSGFISYTDHN